MNIKPPLAAALLMLASTAMAQFTLAPTPAPGAGNYSDLTRPLALSNPYTNIPSDDAFNCSTIYNMHIPWRTCTKEQEASRLSFFGICPFDNMACHNYMERIKLSNNFGDFQRQGEIDGPAAAAAAAKPTEAASATEASPQPGDPNFMGPVMGPPAPDAAATVASNNEAFQRARSQIGENGVKDVILLDPGKGIYALMNKDGTAQVCGSSPKCADPVPASSLENKIINKWVEQEANRAYADNNTPAKGSKGAPAPDGGLQGSTAGSYTPPSDETSGKSPAYNQGLETGKQISAFGGRSQGGDSSNTSSSGRGSATAADAKPIPVGKDEVAAQAAKAGYEFNGVANAAAVSEDILSGSLDDSSKPKPSAKKLEYLGTQSGANSQ